MGQQSHKRRVWVERFLQPWPAFPVGVIVLLVGLLLYVWLRVEPQVEYHSYGPYFYRQRAFAESFLGRPGGLASYAGVFLAQFNCMNWSGALIFVLSECVVFLTALFCLARLHGRAPGFVALAPLFALLLLRNRYGCPAPAISVSFLLALAAAATCVWLPWRRPYLLTAVSGLISSLLFWLAGLWSALLYAVLCCVFVLSRMRHWPAGLGCLVLALAAPLVAVGVVNRELGEFLNPWPERVDWILTAALYISVPFAGAVLVLLPKPAADSSATKPAGCRQPPRLGPAVVVLAFLFGWAVVWFTFDRRQRSLAEMDYDAGCGQYEAVLAAARQVKALNDPAKIRLQLALYHTGRLAEELFSFHSLVEEVPAGGIGEGCRAQSQPLFELGLVNDAEHMACEALVIEGDRPDLLRLLARVHLAKHQPQAAQVFLNVLSLIPFQGERADDAWPTMAAGMPAADRAFLARMHTPVLTNDVLHEGLQLERLLDVLLASNPTNQMAFEYAMASDLLNLDLKKVVAHLEFLDNFKYARIPRPYEEAVLLYQQLAQVQVELKGRAIRSETIERFRQFREAARQDKGGADDPAAMVANFRDTYWYYYFTLRGRERPVEAQTAAP
jgi:hypothetical protein